MSELSSRKSAHRRSVGKMGPAAEVVTGSLPVRNWAIERLKLWTLYAALGAMVVVLLLILFYHPSTVVGDRPPLPLEFVGVDFLPSPTPTSSPTPTRTPLPPPPQIAILSGHWSGDNPPENVVPDTGAICSDGLREVDINRGVAEKVAARLTQLHYRVDVLKEFDERLNRENPTYAPQVFLAIHSDSCVHGPDYPMATGYKIAHAEPSDNPEEDDHLVACLRREYDAQVKPFNLLFNENSITRDMTEYHAFREIVRTTPAAIVELGFMYSDRVELTQHQSELAQGLANGLQAFLKGETCTIP